MAANYGLEIEAGATFSLEFEYRNDDGTLFDFTGWTSKAQIRQTPSSSTALEITTAINAGTSVITISLTANQTATLTSTNYVWAMELTQTATSKVVRLVEGGVVVSPEVVRA
jgi:carbohydrate-binding DOMON domain-containing protein